MSDYTPDEAAFRAMYGHMCAEWCRDAALAELDRFIARVKADALRDSVEYFENLVGVEEFREETRRDGRHWVDPDRAWEEQGPFMGWLRNHADRIEREAGR